MLAAESIYAALKRGSQDLSDYERAIEQSSVGKELWEVRNARQPLQKGLFLGGPLGQGERLFRDLLSRDEQASFVAGLDDPDLATT